MAPASGIPTQDRQPPCAVALDRHGSRPALVRQPGSHRSPPVGFAHSGPHEPDLAIFDLDAGSTASFEAVREAALRLHDALKQAGVRGYPKTSGGGGLHIFVPLAPGYTFERVRQWVKAMGNELASKYPDLIAPARGATHQGGRVTVDYAQNSLGRNTATPYTLRAHPDHPTVSTPLTWEELDAGTIHPASFSPQVILERFSRMGDLFTPVLQADQRIDKL